MEPHLRKQVIIASIFFLIVGTLGFGLFRLIVPAAPPPTPNPFANLAPLKVLSSNLINVESGDYDFVAKVSNPNTGFGSPSVEYDLALSDASDHIVTHKVGTFYILPGQTLYVIDSPLKLDSSVTKVKMTIKSVSWQKLDALSMQALNLVIKDNSGFQLIGQEGIYGKVAGSIVNNSALDLNSADIGVVLVDDNNVPIAVNKTQLRTFLSKTTRGFETSWYVPFAGIVAKTDVQATTNVFNGDSFIQTSGGAREQYQQYY